MRTMTTVEDLATAIVAACGSSRNIAHIEQCFTRLRLDLHDLDTVDIDALQALDEVQLAFVQAGELHLMVTTPLRETVAAVRARAR